MKNIIYFFVLLLLNGCFPSSGEYPAKNIVVKVEKLKQNKSYLFVNDTLSFSGTYFKKSNLTYSDDEDILYHNLKIGDSLITDSSPEKYVIRRRKGEDVIFYTWPHNL